MPPSDRAPVTGLPPRLLIALEQCAHRSGVELCFVDPAGNPLPGEQDRRKPPYPPRTEAIVKGAMEIGPGLMTLVADVWAGVVPIRRGENTAGFLVAFTSSRSAGSAGALTDFLQLLYETIDLYEEAAAGAAATRAQRRSQSVLRMLSRLAGAESERHFLEGLLLGVPMWFDGELTLYRRTASGTYIACTLSERGNGPLEEADVIDVVVGNTEHAAPSVQSSGNPRLVFAMGEGGDDWRLVWRGEADPDVQQLLETIAQVGGPLLAAAARRGRVSVDEALYAPRVFARRLEEELARSRRAGADAGLVVIRFNGEGRGATTYEIVARALRLNVRFSDVLGWIDAEHLGAMLVHTNPAGLATAAARLRSALADTIDVDQVRIAYAPLPDTDLSAADVIAEATRHAGALADAAH